MQPNPLRARLCECGAQPGEPCDLNVRFAGELPSQVVVHPDHRADPVHIGRPSAAVITSCILARIKLETVDLDRAGQSACTCNKAPVVGPRVCEKCGGATTWLASKGVVVCLTCAPEWAVLVEHDVGCAVARSRG